MPLVPIAVGLLASLALGAAAGEAPADLHSRFYQAWREEVAPLMRPAERAAFDALESDAEREAFVRRFWQVRDPSPGTGRNELRDRWQSAVANLAAEEAAGPDQAAAMRLLGARPRLLHKVDCPPLPPMEVWYFSRDWAPPLVADPAGEAGPGEPFYLLFAWDEGAGAFRQVTPEDATAPWQGERSLVDRFGKVLRAGRCLLGAAGAERALDDLEVAFTRALGWQALTSHAGVPTPPERWFDAVAPEPGVALLVPELALSFPGRVGDETVVRGLVRLPPSTGAGAGAIPADGVALTGEVFRTGEVLESFRYAFYGLGEDVRSVPLRFERSLPPGPYGLRLALESRDGSLLWSDIRQITVPGRSEEMSPPDSDPRTFDASDVVMMPDRPAVRLLVPGPGLLVDQVGVAAYVSGFGGRAVDFYLDGRRVAQDTEAPFEARLDLGESPRRHTVRAVALDAEGRAVAEDRSVLNAGPHRFSVHLADPPPDGEAGGVFTARVDLELPAGTRLDHLDLEVNGEPRATLYGPPFVQPLTLPADDVVFVRAAAYLTDGRSAEDVTLVRGGKLGAEVAVQLVELYTTVLDSGGHPVTDLAAEDFAVYDEGEHQSLHGFRKLSEIPLSVCLVVDTSGSMTRSMDTVRDSAVSFFEQVLTPRDQAALVAFNHLARIIAPLTRDLADLERSAHDLQAEGGTALYDALLLSLHYLGGLEGKRTVVLLSDGHDEHSHFELADVQEYARRAGVAIYTIALGKDRRLRPLRRLAHDTGGRSYAVRRAEQLPAVYTEIEQELRAQYLLTYQTPETAGDAFRRVEVRVSRPGLRARTLAGYYPE